MILVLDGVVLYINVDVLLLVGEYLEKLVVEYYSVQKIIVCMECCYLCVLLNNLIY